MVTLANTVVFAALNKKNNSEVAQSSFYYKKLSPLPLPEDGGGGVKDPCYTSL